MAKKLRGYLGLHSWQRIRTGDGQWFKKCRACDKFSGISSIRHRRSDRRTPLAVTVIRLPALCP